MGSLARQWCCDSNCPGIGDRSSTVRAGDLSELYLKHFSNDKGHGAFEWVAFAFFSQQLQKRVNVESVKLGES